jgi:hypothetical protein
VSSVVGQVPVGTATIAIADDLLALELQMVWKRDNTSAILEMFIDTARGRPPRRLERSSLTAVMSQWRQPIRPQA